MPTPYYSAQTVRELDRTAIEQHGIAGFTLMQRAGQRAFATLRSHWPRAQSVLVCCGTGNNGGDGLVIAALASAAGLHTTVLLAGERTAFKGDAAKALALADSNRVDIRENAAFPGHVAADTVIVDALLGIGLTGPVRPAFRVLIDAINASGLPVLAIDIPSGLCSDTGEVRGACVRAAVTVTFIGRKAGLIRGSGPAMAGEVVFDDLGVPPAVYDQAVPVLSLP